MGAKVALLILICFCLAAVGGGCADRATPVGVPRISFEKPQWDLGEIPVDPAKPYSVQIPCTNYGSGKLQVKRFQISCGCLAASINSNPIAPGEGAVITLDISRRAPERRRASLIVFSNDPNAPQFELLLCWRAVGRVEFDPPSIDLGTIIPGEAIRATTTLICNDGGSAERFGVIKINPAGGLRAWWQPPEAGGAAMRRSLLIEVVGDERPGEAFANVSITQDADGGHDLNLPVRWRTSDVVDVYPRRLMLQPGHAGERRQKQIVVSAARGAKLAIDEIDVDENALGASWSCTKVGDSAARISLESTLPDSPGCHRFNLDISCREPERRKISVPVIAYVLQDLSDTPP